jgi:hypothetical protein
MGERKILNKYIPADFDPSLVPKHKNTKAGKKEAKKLGRTDIRLMIPFSCQCSTCGTFMYRGKKFNASKEDVVGAKAKYLNTQRYRFYIKCIVCSRQITFLTDPENGDYEMEDGAVRNYEMWKDKNSMEEGAKGEREDEDKLDSMKALENRVEDSRREMRELDELDEIKALNSRHVNMSVDQVLQASKGSGKGANRDGDDDSVSSITGLSKRDEELAASIKFGSRQEDVVIESDESDDDDDGRKGARATTESAAVTTATSTAFSAPAAPAPAAVAPVVAVLIKKRKIQPKTGDAAEAKKAKAAPSKPVVPAPSALSLLGDYGSDSD